MLKWAVREMFDGVCREEVNGVLEKARGERFLGSALEAKVLLHVANAELAQSLQALQGVSLRALHIRLPQTEHRFERKLQKCRLESHEGARDAKLPGICTSCRNTGAMPLLRQCEREFFLFPDNTLIFGLCNACAGGQCGRPAALCIHRKPG